MSDDKPPSSEGLGVRSLWQRVSHALMIKPRDREELVELLKDDNTQGLLDREGRRMIAGVLEVSETQVRDIMIPRPHMVVLEKDLPAEELLTKIIESGHSRFPVIGEDRDEVLGILLAKDLLRFFVEDDRTRFDIRECVRNAVFIPETKRLNILLKEFRDSHNHMAVVVDEYGGVSGLITIEDVIETIIGDIDDEHDVENDAFIKPESDKSFTVRALTRIDDFNEHFGTVLDDENYDTIGGMMMHELGHLPRRGETLVFGPLEFEVVRSDRRRIDVLRVTRLPAKTGDEAVAE